MLWTRYLENGLTDPTKLHQWTCMDSASDEFDRVRIMGILMSCLCVRPSGCCERDLFRTAWRILTTLHWWTCMDSASDEFDRVQIIHILMTCSGMWLVDTGTRYLENGLTDSDHTSPVDLYGWCCQRIRSRANYVHTNELRWHLIGRYYECDISKTVWQISTTLHQWTCMDTALHEFNRIQIMQILMSLAGIWYCENGLTDSYHTSPVDLYGQCLGWVQSHANYANTNVVSWHLIGQYCEHNILRMA